MGSRGSRGSACEESESAGGPSTSIVIALFSPGSPAESAVPRSEVTRYINEYVGVTKLTTPTAPCPGRR
jgi:hypothetical protein